MQDVGPVLVSVCGLLCVGGGLLAVIAFVVLKATGRTLLGAFDEIGGVAAALGIGEVNSDTDTDGVPANRGGRRRSNIRARAESLDFDSAVARQSAQPPATQRPSTSVPSVYVTPPAPTPAQPPVSSPFDDDSLPTLRKRRTLRDRKDEGDDDPDMLAGLMGEE